MHCFPAVCTFFSIYFCPFSTPYHAEACRCSIGQFFPPRFPLISRCDPLPNLARHASSPREAARKSQTPNIARKAVTRFPLPQRLQDTTRLKSVGSIFPLRLYLVARSQRAKRSVFLHFVQLPVLYFRSTHVRAVLLAQSLPLRFCFSTAPLLLLRFSLPSAARCVRHS
ncbi:hypothetical protein TRVL_04155 [Trypanosoma vivax]|nr:hypothetical protein TRVL_04155 [Trypanosoma vivax]